MKLACRRFTRPWEGKTLVVETTNFSRQNNVVGSDQNLELVERFTRVGPNRTGSACRIGLARQHNSLSPMRGVVLLVDSDGAIDPTPLREAGLLVYEAADERAALERLSDLAPDALVVGQTVSLTDLRRHVDHATSIIVVGGNEDPPERLRTIGADSFLSLSGDLVYEIHRALILRRSGRRLPWNW